MFSRSDLVLIQRIYEASINPDLWPNVLDELSHRINARGAFIVTSRFDQTGYELDWKAGLWRDYDFAAYAKRYSHFEAEHIQKVFQSQPLSVITDAAFEDREKILKRPDVASTSKELGVLDRIGVRLNADPGWFDALACQFDISRGNITNEEKEVLALYTPHLAQSVVLSRTFNTLKNRYQAVLGVLDKVNLGIMLCTATGEIVLSNDAARQITMNNPLMRISSSQRIHIKDSNTSNAIINAISRAALTASARSSSERAAFRLRHHGEHLLVGVAPIRDTDGELDHKFEGAVLSIVDPNRIRKVEIKGLANFFRLTRTEVDVVKLILKGYRNREIAETRNVKYETVKSCVSNIYLKTGAANRVDLVFLALSIDLPITL